MGPHLPVIICEVERAPEPNDIIWEHYEVTDAERRQRKASVAIGCSLLLAVCAWPWIIYMYVVEDQKELGLEPVFAKVSLQSTMSCNTTFIVNTFIQSLLDHPSAIWS